MRGFLMEGAYPVKSFGAVYFQRRPCSEEHATFLSVITWWWQTKLIWKGWRRPLVYDDLDDLCHRDKSVVAATKFNKYWDQEVRRAG